MSQANGPAAAQARSRQAALAAAQAGSAARARRRIHAVRRRSAAAFPTAGSTPATSSARASPAARCSQRSTRSTRSIHVRRARRRCTSRTARTAAGAGGRCPDPPAGRGRLQLARPLDFTDNGIEPEFGHDPRARRGPQSRLLPDARHVRQHAARRGGTTGACSSPTRDPHRPGAQDGACRGQGRHGRGQAGRARSAGRRPSRHPLRPHPPTAWSSGASSSPCRARKVKPRVTQDPPSPTKAAPTVRSPQAPSASQATLAGPTKRESPNAVQPFLHRRPIFAGVIAIIITLVGASPSSGCRSRSIRSRAADGHGQRRLSGRLRRDRRRHRRRADRAADQRRRNMLYMSSQSTGDGRLTITVTFKLGTDLDNAQVLVQNRVALAEPRLPEEVRRIGVVVRKTLARLPDGRQHRLARQFARSRLHLQLRSDPAPRPARAPRRRRRRPDVRRAATMRCASGSIRASRRRGLTAGEIVAALRGAERPGRGRRARPAAVRHRRRASSSRSRRRAASPTRSSSRTSS